MIRMLINLGLSILANAVGLIVAAALLDDMALGASGFIIAVLVFTGVLILVRPMITKLAIKHASALGGSSALLATVVGLVVTAIVSDSLSIRGALTWVLATVIVWAASLVGGLFLPWLLLRKTKYARKPPPPNAASNVRTWG